MFEEKTIKNIFHHNFLWRWQPIILKTLGPWSLWWSQKCPPKPPSPLWISKKKSMSYLIFSCLHTEISCDTLWYHLIPCICCNHYWTVSVVLFCFASWFPRLLTDEEDMFWSEGDIGNKVTINTNQYPWVWSGDELLNECIKHIIESLKVYKWVGKFMSQYQFLQTMHG